MLEIKDRVPTQPGRIKLIDEKTGEAKYYTLERADEPTQEGTPLNKATLDAMRTAENLYVSDDLKALLEANNVEEALLKAPSQTFKLLKEFTKTARDSSYGVNINYTQDISDIWEELINYKMIAIMVSYTCYASTNSASTLLSYGGGVPLMFFKDDISKVRSGRKSKWNVSTGFGQYGGRVDATITINQLAGTIYSSTTSSSSYHGDAFIKIYGVA